MYFAQADTPPITMTERIINSILPYVEKWGFPIVLTLCLTVIAGYYLYQWERVSRERNASELEKSKLESLSAKERATIQADAIQKSSELQTRTIQYLGDQIGNMGRQVDNLGKTLARVWDKQVEAHEVQNAALEDLGDTLKIIRDHCKCNTKSLQGLMEKEGVKL